jgi:hypothetical protein
MKRYSINLALGVLLLTVGILSLLQNLNILVGATGLIWASVFGVSGIGFIYAYLANRDRWWPVIPGFCLLGIAFLIGISELAPKYEDIVGAPALFIAMSMCFWLIYFHRQEQWWAIIPAGVMLSLAGFISLDAIFKGVDLVGVFFLGLGLTFIAVAVLPKTKERTQWAYIPAAILMLMGVIFLASEVSVFQYIGPAALVLVGVYLVIRAFGGRRNF